MPSALTVSVSSGTEMIDRIAVSFSIRIDMFTIAGSMSIVISGRMMRAIVCAGESPTQSAASIWPFGTASKPARQSSE